MTDLIERLREIPVWMVRDMAPGWQEHGTAAYEAADEIAALRARVAELEGALRQIAKPGVGLQAIQEDYGHDANAYNFQAMKYFALRCHWLQSIARAILSKQEPEYSGWVEVVEEDRGR